ncbi:RlmE family RNA methyltransferase [Candidatus Pelagibacter ubique]|uniref:Ribosomal RNA large subunit methyltransferase E n=2 Tax=Pelagibacter ubique TaxID=198252 RepID=RLME_PELUB|nr:MULTISPECIES: RlmE family RNA methyltransferase [Pelagibacter]Q4FMX1.1 RecName: Full=Ribosomal RNA large subunit methyltransferase E; AltName: Full=23S rRNA Um2552 methyltransferase; AltName: Full=rRNA (uridine-2'-O-)-methyltransferase [Candidatus Pelagibacter ubique HTCC1062]MDA7699756.1 RlmE family RNA methyltransferase [Candidatus Pelagibacter sp.]AAZ21468.1 FtsJ-like methyltransferase [Candidatus Pelagibacter ubique HTCC1062]EAS84670.1 FtsJ-like methyltransferase [Candidatus Pelagibacter
MKKNRISKNWINKQKRDIYVRQSQVDGYRARSAYKLIEIDEKFKIFKNGISVIDLGASPGSWSQYISRTVKSGRLVSIDLKGMEEIENTIQIKGDFTDLESQEKIKALFKSKVDVVVSDMAVNTTGIKDIDAIYTGELAMEAMNFSKEMLVKEGRFVSKIFLGSSFNEIVALGKKLFKEVKVFKPKSSRKESKESFIICKILR